MENIIEIKHLVKKYPSFKLDDVSFNIPFGSIVGLIGGNGSGKTTTMKCILSLIFKNSGEIHIFSKNYNELSDIEKEKIGVVLDENCLPANLKVSFLDKIFSYTFKTWDSKKYFDYLNKFNIDKNKRVKELSKGMKAKLNIIIALTRDVEVLVLDEPVNGLDPISRDELNTILLDFVADKKHSVFISSHILSDIEIISDEIVFIDGGKIYLNCKTKELINKYDILNLTKEEFNKIDKTKIIKYKKSGNRYTIGVNKGECKEFLNRRNATLEDIMVFHIKGKDYEGSIN